MVTSQPLHLHLSAVPGSFCSSTLVGLIHAHGASYVSLLLTHTHTHTQTELELPQMCQSSEKVTIIHHPVIPKNLALIRGFFSFFPYKKLINSPSDAHSPHSSREMHLECIWNVTPFCKTFQWLPGVPRVKPCLPCLLAPHSSWPHFYACAFWLHSCQTRQERDCASIFSLQH